MRSACIAERRRTERIFGRKNAPPIRFWNELPLIAEDAPAFERKFSAEMLTAPGVWAYCQQVEEVRTVNPARALELAERVRYQVPEMRARLTWRLRVASQVAIAAAGALRTIGEYDDARGQYAAAYKLLRRGPFGAVDYIDLDIKRVSLALSRRELDLAWMYANHACRTAKLMPGEDSRLRYSDAL